MLLFFFFSPPTFSYPSACHAYKTLYNVQDLIISFSLSLSLPREEMARFRIRRRGGGGGVELRRRAPVYSNVCWSCLEGPAKSRPFSSSCCRMTFEYIVWQTHVIVDRGEREREKRRGQPSATSRPGRKSVSIKSRKGKEREMEQARAPTRCVTVEGKWSTWREKEEEEKKTDGKMGLLMVKRAAGSQTSLLLFWYSSRLFLLPLSPFLLLLLLPLIHWHANQVSLSVTPRKSIRRTPPDCCLFLSLLPLGRQEEREKKSLNDLFI